ncbi:hypothetical protein LTR78_010891, partial [Recurvomyces mirabilis]
MVGGTHGVSWLNVDYRGGIQIALSKTPLSGIVKSTAKCIGGIYKHSRGAAAEEAMDSSSDLFNLDVNDSTNDHPLGAIALYAMGLSYTVFFVLKVGSNIDS